MQAIAGVQVRYAYSIVRQPHWLATAEQAAPEQVHRITRSSTPRHDV